MESARRIFRQADASEEEVKRYLNYVSTDLDSAHLTKFTKRQMERIKCKLRPEWFTNLMLKSLVKQLTIEISSSHQLALKHAVVQYILMDVEERRRVNIRQPPKRYK